MIRVEADRYRESGPQPRREDFGPIDDYLLAWHTWRATVRDGEPTRDERDAAFRVLATALGHPDVGLWDE